jgi:hypothetical protein
VAAESLEILLRVWEEPGSVLGLEIGYYNRDNSLFTDHPVTGCHICLATENVAKETRNKKSI